MVDLGFSKPRADGDCEEGIEDRVAAGAKEGTQERAISSFLIKFLSHQEQGADSQGSRSWG